MGLIVSASQAAQLVGRHERIVRGWIGSGKLHATKASDGIKWQIDTDDLLHAPNLNDKQRNAIRNWVDRTRKNGGYEVVSNINQNHTSTRPLGRQAVTSGHYSLEPQYIAYDTSDDRLQLHYDVSDDRLQLQIEGLGLMRRDAMQEQELEQIRVDRENLQVLQRQIAELQREIVLLRTALKNARIPIPGQ